jgi:hypothetical protein
LNAWMSGCPADQDDRPFRNFKLLLRLDVSSGLPAV